MFEYHGWITIEESTSEVNQGNLINIVNGIKNEIKKHNWDHGLMDLRPINGAYHLSLSGFTNHKSQESKDIMSMAPNGPISPDSTWHHNEDGRMLQEVDKGIHRNFTHRGGISGMKKK